MFRRDKYNNKNPSLKKNEVQNSSNLISYFSSKGNFLNELVTSLSYCYMFAIDWVLIQLIVVSREWNLKIPWG